MAISQPSHSVRQLGLMGTVLWLGGQLFSFETFFLLFLYGVQVRQILPTIPTNEAYVFGAITIVMGAWIILRDGLYLRGVPILLTGLLFIGWMVLSIGWTPSRILFKDNLRFLLTVDLWAIFAGTCIVAGSRERVVRLLLMIAALALILAVYGVYIQLVYGSFRFYHYIGAGDDWARSAYIAWGYIVASGAAVILALAIFSKLGSLKQLLALFALGVFGYFLLIASGRGPLLALLLAGLAATFVQTPRIGQGRIEFPQTQVIALGIVVMSLAYLGYLYVTSQTTGALQRFLILLDQADDPLLRTGANRFDYFAAAYQLWLEAPLFGHGLSSFATLFTHGMEIPGTYPHNAILQILAEFGVIGMLFFGLFVVVGLRNISLDRLRQDPLCLALFMVFMTFVVQTMVAGDITRSYRFFFILGLLAMRPPEEKGKEEEEEEEDEAEGG